MKTLPLPALLAVLVLGLIMTGPSLLGLYTDWLWFREVGFSTLYATMLRAQGLVFTVVFVTGMIWLTLNLRHAVATVTHPTGTAHFLMGARGEVTISASRQRLIGIGNVLALIIAILVGLLASGQWERWLGWWFAVPFGRTDPILGLEASFYVFSLPFYRLALGLAQALLVLAALASGGLYFAAGHLRLGQASPLAMSAGARRHLAVLASVFLVLLAAGAWLSRAGYLTQPSGIIQGASYADVQARMPAAFILAAVGLVGAGLALVQAFSRRNWPIPVAAVLYVVISIGGAGYAALLQRFVVTPNEQTRESPYIQHNIDATRFAFNLHDVEERELSGDALLTADDIEANAQTLENVRLWDHQPLLQTFGQIQEIRTYYDFVSVDNDRYTIDGRLRQVMLSPRELNSSALPNLTWVNERLTFTHGYGLTLGPVNQVTEEGLPVLFVQDLPPTTTADITIDEPSIYYGELSNDYVIVNTATREFHYPRGDDNVFTQYGGTGGLLLDSLWRKVVFALRFGSYQLLLSDDIGPESRILFNRNIRERVRLLTPFLSFDQDPYMVVVDGRLYWILDAYTTSDQYPYSSAAGRGLNYIRNSVKFVVDAYHGTTTIYAADAADPILATYGRIFPGVFTPLDEMPPALRAHVRYPEDIFALQSSVFATYHMTQPAVFYNREDQWEIPALDDGGETRPMLPYYTIMRLPGEPEPEFIQMLPFTPRRRDNLAAWLVARSDGEHYGRLRVFQFPKQKLVFGPRQVVARISQDQTIAPQITLWNQQGSEVIWGTLMVIPIEESLIYVRPLYLRASGGRIPELTRVIAAYNNQIVMEPTLDEALVRLFEGNPSLPATPVSEDAALGAATEEPLAPGAGAPQPAVGPTSLAALSAEAQQRYDSAMEAQRNGDWARYGEEIRRLGELLARMRATR